MKALAVAIFVGLIVFAVEVCHADTGLAMRCDGITKSTQAAACTGPRSWITPKTGDYVLSFTTIPLNSTTVAWNDINLQFREWSSIPMTFGVLVCNKSLTGSQTLIPVGGTDQCAPGADTTLKTFVARNSVAVPPAFSKTVTLTWTAPTQNADGSPLTNLSGYKVYIGSSPSNLLIAGTISNPGLLTWTSAPLTTGTYYFTVSCFNAVGESAQSSPPVTYTVSPSNILPGAVTGVQAKGN